MPQRQRGKGLSDKLWGSEFPGERHMPLKVGNKFKRAQYAGPGTALIKRLKRGDPGISETDRASMAHDIRYGLAPTAKGVREADEKMVAALKRISAKGTDSRFNTFIAQRGIEAKMAMENMGITKIDTFTTPAGAYDKETMEMLRDKERELSQQGYGHKKKMNAYFKMMLAAKRKGLRQFTYKGKTYIGHEHPNLGLIYKRA